MRAPLGRNLHLKMPKAQGNDHEREGRSCSLGQGRAENMLCV